MEPFTLAAIFMKTVFFIGMILFINSVYGQTKKVITIPTTINYKNEIDTSLWFKSTYDLVREINLKDLQNSTDTFHFRFWTDSQAVDIWTIDHNSYFGQVTDFACRYNDKLFRKGIYKIDKIYSNQFSIDSAKARQIFDFIDFHSIGAIPTDDKIKGWGQGLDGQEYLIETSTSTTYDFKTYWSPWVFVDSVNEARRIQALAEYLYNDPKINDYHQKLELPKGHYQRSGIPGIKIKI